MSYMDLPRSAMGNLQTFYSGEGYQIVPSSHVHHLDLVWRDHLVLFVTNLHKMDMASQEPAIRG